MDKVDLSTERDVTGRFRRFGNAGWYANCVASGGAEILKLALKLFDSFVSFFYFSTSHLLLFLVSFLAISGSVEDNQAFLLI